MKRTNRKNACKDRPTLPELDQTKRSVLNSLTSLQSRRSYQHAMDEFVEWYCPEPPLALNRAVVLRYRLQLEAKKLAASTINVRLASSSGAAPGLRGGRYRVAEPRTGRRHPASEGRTATRTSRWQLAQRCTGRKLLSGTTAETLRQKRDAAIISLSSAVDCDGLR
jgi:hypothetical protein